MSATYDGDLHTSYADRVINLYIPILTLAFALLTNMGIGVMNGRFWVSVVSGVVFILASVILQVWIGRYRFKKLSKEFEESNGLPKERWMNAPLLLELQLSCLLINFLVAVVLLLFCGILQFA